MFFLNIYWFLLAFLFLIIAFFLYDIYFLWLWAICIILSIIVKQTGLSYLNFYIILSFLWTSGIWWTTLFFLKEEKEDKKEKINWLNAIVQIKKNTKKVHIDGRDYEIINSKDLNHGDMVKIVEQKNNKVKVKKVF